MSAEPDARIGKHAKGFSIKLRSECNMKRLSQRDKWRLIRHAELSFRRRKRKKHGTRQIVYELVHVPKSFDLLDNYEECMRFINQLAHKVLIDRTFVKIDFGSCASMSADAALVLAAEVDRCVALRTYRGKPKLHGTYPSDKSVRRFLQELGFYKLLSLREPESSIDLQNQRFIQMRTGVRAKGQIIDELERVVFSDVVRFDIQAGKALFRGLSEAMTNVARHAYDTEFEQSLPVKRGQWWMAGYWNRDRHEIMAFMYDQGVGIPTTLPKTHKEQVGILRRVLGRSTSDADLVKLSMQLGETRTAAPQHGKGMADLKRLVELAREGHLRVLSGKGRYLYARKDDASHERNDDLVNPVNGTFIEWRVSDSELIRWQQ